MSFYILKELLNFVSNFTLTFSSLINKIKHNHILMKQMELLLWDQYSNDWLVQMVKIRCKVANTLSSRGLSCCFSFSVFVKEILHYQIYDASYLLGYKKECSELYMFFYSFVYIFFLNLLLSLMLIMMF